MVALYFVGMVTVSFVSYLFLIQLTILNFLVFSAFFVFIVAGLNLKFFGHQLERNAVWSTLLKLLGAALANFLVPVVMVWFLVLIFVMVVADFLSFRFVGGLLAITLFFVGRVHFLVYLAAFIIPVILGGVNFLVFFMLPFTTIFFTKSMIVLESFSLYLITYLALITVGLQQVQVSSSSTILAFLRLSLL